MAFSPDGQRIVTGSFDATAKVWETASGKELLTLKAHPSGFTAAGITSVAFSPDGQRIFAGSDDTTAKVWEAASGKELLTLKGHTAGIQSVAFSPDDRRVVAGREHGTALVREAASEVEVAGWRRAEHAAAEVQHEGGGQVRKSRVRPLELRQDGGLQLTLQGIAQSGLWATSWRSRYPAGFII